MAKAKLRKCVICGIEEMTASKSKICASCYIAEKKNVQIESEKENIKSFGYMIVSGPRYGKFSKREYEIKNPNCNHSFFMRYDNLCSLFKNRQKLSCAICGSQARISKALDGYIEKYGRNYDISKLRGYTKEVRAVSELTYKENIHILNPHNKIRGHTKFHLDHVVPVRQCFEMGISVEKASSLQNLQILHYLENVGKRDYILDYNAAKCLGGDISKCVPKNLIDILDNIQTDKKILIKNKCKVYIDNEMVIEIYPNNKSISSKLSHFIFRDYELTQKKDQIISMIRNKIHNNTNKIYARQCKIIEIFDSKIEKTFIDKNHIQGYIPSSICLGLEYNGRIVSIMTFRPPRFTKKYQWELLRFCSEQNTNVIGGASKLLKHFILYKKPSSIISYANEKWSCGELYKTLGFDLLSSNNKSYYYYKSDQIIPRYKAQKHKLHSLLSNFDPSKTEVENMIANGYEKVYDLCQITYLLNQTKTLLPQS